MKSIPVTFDKDRDEIVNLDGGQEETWDAVCEQFDDDVHRIRDVASHPPYTGLYACYDEDNNPSYYLVEEDRQLEKMRHRVFFDKLGRKGE